MVILRSSRISTSAKFKIVILDKYLIMYDYKITTDRVII